MTTLHHAQPKPTSIKIDMNQPVTESMRKKAAEVVMKAKVQLTINHPFFAQVVLGRKIAISDDVPTAYVTPRGFITVGTRFAAALSVQQAVFLLAHEAMHYAMLHGLRRVYRDPRKWNIACDAVINDLLQESKVGEFIEGGVDMKGSKDKTSEQVYEQLPEQKGGDGYSPGEGFDDLKDGEDGGGQGDRPPTESEMREIEEQVRVELANAAQVAKQQGKLPSGLEKVIDEIVHPLTPWHQLLERFMTSFVDAGLTWRRPNRRLRAHGLYMPTVDKEPRMGPVGIFRDSSGSCMDAATQAHFLGHINAILERCRPEKVYVIDCDCVVENVAEFTIDDLPIGPGKANPKGGGGTSFKPPFDYIAENGIELDCAVYLTDMYGNYPTEKPPYQTVWLTTTDKDDAPFGDVIKYRCEE
jgi:predicted metal-dependent peptidase